MVRLTTRDKETVLEQIRNGVPDKDLKEQWGLTSPQLRKYYLLVFPDQKSNQGGQIGNKNAVGRSQPKTIDDDPIDDGGLSADDILGVSQPVQPTLDPNKNYCGGCYEKGIATVIQEGQKVCHVCGGLF